MSRVGAKIKEARENAKVTQKSLAKKLGVAEKYINEVETGRRIINESFIQKVEKALNVSLNDVNMVVTDEALNKEKEELKIAIHNNNNNNKKSPKNVEVNEMWNQAFASVLKNVPVYDETLKRVLGSKQLPIHDNKIEGIAQDKVFYVTIESDDMASFRIQSGDNVLCSSIKEFSSNGIYLVSIGDKVFLRQVKKLDSTKVLLLSNKGAVRTETYNVKEIKFLAKALKVEFSL